MSNYRVKARDKDVITCTLIGPAVVGVLHVPTGVRAESGKSAKDARYLLNDKLTAMWRTHVRRRVVV